jgi:hypothetical protein
MDGFLVIARCGMDDIPLRFFTTREEALENARSTTVESILDLAPEIMCVDVSIVINVSILEFCSGVPKVVVEVWSIDGDGDDGDDDDGGDDDAPPPPEDEGDDDALALAAVGGSDDDGLS